MYSSSHSSMLRVRVLRSGSAGNAIFVEADGTRLLIDAGLPAETIVRELETQGIPARLHAILLTHEHDDHLRGASAVARASGAVVLANEATLRAAAGQLAGTPTEVFRTGRPFEVGPIEVIPFRLPHDAVEPVGFVLYASGARVVVACDLGDATDAVIAHARGADLLLVEANYDLRLLTASAYPWFLKNRIVGPRGHLSNDGAARVALAAAAAGARTVQLVHVSEANNLAPLARDTVRAALDAHGLDAVVVEAVRPNAAGPWWGVPTAFSAPTLPAPVASR